jgi:hypothetical protein
MNLLLAPNGKPSKLTPEQYELVRKPEFKAWFGDWENNPESASKVVDFNGEPLVVYHGTTKKFNVFNREYAYYQNWYGLGFYFTDNIEDVKSNYTSKGYDLKQKIKVLSKIKNIDKNKIKKDLIEDDYLISVFLDIKNPINVFNKIGKDNSKKIFDIEPILEKKFGYDVYGFLSYIQNRIGGYEVPFEKSFSKYTYWEFENILRNLAIKKENQNITGEVIRAIYEILGFDGIIMNPYHIFNNLEKGTMNVDEKTNHYISFQPNQIKLADGSNTTFDSNNNDIRFDEGGFVMDEEKGEKFIKKLSELGCNKPLTNFQMNFFGFLDSLKDDCVSLGGFWYDSNTTNYAYSQMGKMVLFDIEDFYNEKERTAFIEENYPTSTPLEIQPFDDDNYEFIGIGEASMGGVFRDIRDGSILKLTASPFEVVGTTKILNAQKKDIQYEDNFAEIYSITNIGKGVFKGTWYYKYYNEREWSGNWFAIRREDITPFNEQEQKEANCVKEIIVNYYSMFDNRNYQPEIFGSYDIYEPNREFQYLLRKQNNYGEGGDINWNLERYREVEKEMFELRKQGKGDTLEYFKLIKERAILEQAKMNQNNNTENNFAKGGKVIVQPADIQKYKKIGVEDKYFIEASKDVGLQGINFDSKSILKRIESQFNDMLENYESYLINEDSPSITNYINNEIETHKEQGSSLETIQRLEQTKDNESARRSIIDDIAKTQNESLEKWVDYLRLSEYKLPFKFLILKAVLNFNYDLKQSKLFERGRDTIRNFTPFDAGSLAELNEKNSDFLLMDYNVIMNENSSKILNSQEVVEQSGNGKWIKFNGGSKTKPEDIEKNGNRLMNLVQNTYWCTKSAGTSQLRGGDFYVYVTEANGEIFPRIAVRMDEDKVGEVRGNKSSAQDLDAEMLPIAEEFLNKNIPNNSGKKWLDSIKYNKKCVEMRKRFEAEGMYKDFIYDYMKLIADTDKYKVDYGANGNVTLLEQKFEEIINIPNEYYQKGDIVTNYKLLSKNTIYFIGDLGNYELEYTKSHIDSVSDLRDLSNWKLKLISGSFQTDANMNNLGNIEYVGTNLYINNNNRYIKDLGKLKYVGGQIHLNDNIESLSNLENIGGGFEVKKGLKDLGKLKKVGFLMIWDCDENFTFGSLEEIEGDLYINTTSVDINFGNLKTIGGNLFAGKSMVTNLKELESVGGDFNIAGSKIKKFENLKTIGGNADFSNNFCSSTQNIETILGNIKFLNSRIMEFPKLNKIGGTIEFRGSYFKSFGNIKYIGGSLNFAESKLEELGELDYVGGYVSFKGSKIKSLNKLKKVVGFANFDGSIVEDLGDLESVGGNLYVLNSKIKSLGKINYVGGTIMMNKGMNIRVLDGSFDKVSALLNK